MLDPRFKSLHLISSFVGQEEGAIIVDKYDRRTLYHMFLKCYHNFHPMIESIECVNQIVDENCSMDLFQQIASTSKPAKEHVTKELLIFKRYQMDPKNIRYHLQWWRKYEAMFPIIGFLAHQILNIIRSQFEIEKINSLTCIFTLKEMSFTIKQLRKIDFCEQKLAK
jgi:hypothetical protein